MPNRKKKDIGELPVMWRLLISAVLLAIAVAYFVYAPPQTVSTVSTTTTVSPTVQTTEAVESRGLGLAKLLEWVGIGAFVLAVWIWRKELGLSQFGPLGAASDKFTQQPPGEPLKDSEGEAPPPSFDLSTIAKEMDDEAVRQQLDAIMQMFTRTHSVNATYVAHKLKIPTRTAQTLLYQLKKAGILRADGFPTATIYTPAGTMANRILDATKRKLEEKYGVLSERRYVRLKRGRQEIDAVLESDDRTFLVEAKITRMGPKLPQLDNWISRLVSVADSYPADNIVCVLSLGCFGDSDVEKLRQQLTSMTFDGGRFPVQVYLFSENELG